uniref:DRBM domain-containing protein n=1 Tax=Daucus carota subsp. sativus TaxID=79200 RepID=A0A166CAY6_DAUCS
MYKTKLQELCQQKKWALPKYSYVKEGPDHNPSFKASVVVKGVTFDTEIASNSSKDAQNDAARLAVHHFTASEPEGETKTGQPGIELHQAGKLQSNATEFKNDERNQYKLMLQTYAQRNKLGMPVYSSDKKGPPHAPCFKATVYVEGHPYDSPGTYKTLKEAEHAAAQNCPPLYKNILQELAQSEGKRSRTANSSSSSSAHETLEVKAGSVFPTFVNAHGKFQSDCPQHLTQNSNYRKQCIQEKDDYEDCPTESLPDYSKYSLQKFIESPASADMDNTTGNSDSHFSPESIRLSSTGGQPSSIITPPDLSSLTIRSPTLKKSDETESYLLCNRYRVYTRIPDIDFPKGTILLPIAEDQWVAVSIELPN